VAENTYISFFAGIGGLDLAVRLAVPCARCVCYVEAEVPAAANLAARIEEGSLDDAPVWSDVRTFDGKPWRGIVDGVVGGFPCPDYSVAGKRAGITGKHGQLWNDFCRAIGEILPSWVLLENVPGIVVPHRAARWRWDRERQQWSRYVLPAGLWFVLGDLAALGFDAEWGCLSAAQVGAPHKRERWFCLAYREGRGLGMLRQSSKRAGFTGGAAKGWNTPSTEDFKIDGPVCLARYGTDDMMDCDQRLRNQAATWHTPHGMTGVDASGKQGGGGEFAKQATQWPTPDASMSSGGRQSAEPMAIVRPSGTKKAITLNDAAQSEMWTTPQAHDSGGASRKELGVKEPSTGAPTSPTT
jgi:DNA (cytosine-5)-methyltransferase 1